MRVRRAQAGYAMLAAILVGALAATFALAVFGAAAATQDVTLSDSAAWRARAAESRAAGLAMRELRWHPWLTDGTVRGADVSQAEDWRATWMVAQTAPGSLWPRRRVDVYATCGPARRASSVILELRAQGWATGVTCSGDAEFRAPFTVVGSGLYAGGCVRGRESVDFTGSPIGGEALDGARPERFSRAGVHAAAAIFSHGVEIHSAGASSYPDDQDAHTGAVVPADWVDGPSAEFLVDAEERAEGPGSAFSEGVLRLSELPAAQGAGPGEGRCLLVPAADVVIEGVAPPEAGRLLVVAPGDAVVGQPGGTVELDGGLVVGGLLFVRGSLVLHGPLHAGTLLTEASVSVTLDQGWRDEQPAGSILPVVVEQDG